MIDSYGADYDRFIARAAQSSLRRWTLRRDILARHAEGGSLLDLGCGSGMFLECMKAPSWKLYGVEMSPEPASEARIRSGALVYVGDILDAPFPAGSFDAITCFDVLEHVYRPDLVIKRVSQWLKPGGVFHTLLPNIDSGQARVFGSYWYGLELPRHLHHFSPASLRRLAGASGLEELSLVTSPGPLIEYSFHYLLYDFLRALGIKRLALSSSGDPSFLWRVVRKGFRIAVLPVLTRLISLWGDGEVMEAIFRKPRP